MIMNLIKPIPEIIVSTLITTPMAVYVDPAAGSDANLGTLASPWKTLANVPRYFSVSPLLLSTLDVFLLNDAPAGDDFIFQPRIGTNGAFYFHGALVPTGGGTLTAVTRARAKATNVPLGVTDGAQAWAAHIDELFVDTTVGPNSGALAWIEKDEGANVARLTPAVIPSLTTQFANNPPEVTPTAGDTYTTNRLVKIAGAFSLTPIGNTAFQTNAARCVVDKIDFAPDQTGRIAFSSFSSIGGTKFLLFNCRFSNTPLFPPTNMIDIVNCYSIPGASLNPAPGANLNLVAGGARTTGATALFGEGRIFIRNGYQIQAGGAVTNQISMVNAANVLVFDLGIFDWTAQAISVDQASYLELVNDSALWGTSAVGGSFAINVRGGFVGFNVSLVAKMPIAGAVGTFTLNGRTTGPAIDYVAAPPVYTLNRAYTPALVDAATGAGGFGGSVSEPSSGCCGIHIRN